MLVLDYAHHKLAILRAYFYRQRRGVRSAEGASVGKLQKTSDCCGAIEAKAARAQRSASACSAANAHCTPTAISRSAVRPGG
jgi:hypothetical protein